MSGLVTAELGKRMYFNRLGLNMTAQDLADRAGVPLDVVIGFELGWMGIEIEHAKAILDVFGMKLDDIQALNRALNEWYGPEEEA